MSPEAGGSGEPRGPLLSRLESGYRRGVEVVADAPAVLMSIPAWAAAFRQIWRVRGRDLRSLHTDRATGPRNLESNGDV